MLGAAGLATAHTPTPAIGVVPLQPPTLDAALQLRGVRCASPEREHHVARVGRVDCSCERPTTRRCCPRWCTRSAPPSVAPTGGGGGDLCFRAIGSEETLRVLSISGACRRQRCHAHRALRALGTYWLGGTCSVSALFEPVPRCQDGANLLHAVCRAAVRRRRGGSGGGRSGGYGCGGGADCDGRSLHATTRILERGEKRAAAGVRARRVLLFALALYGSTVFAGKKRKRNRVDPPSTPPPPATRSNVHRPSRTYALTFFILRTYIYFTPTPRERERDHARAPLALLTSSLSSEGSTASRI